MGKKAKEKKQKKVNTSDELKVASAGTSGIFSNHFLHIIIVFFMIYLAYSNIFHAPFVFDDDLNIAENIRIRHLGNFWPPSETRWFGYLTFALNYRFGGFDPYGYHVVNLIIHMINSLLVYWLVRLIFNISTISTAIREHKNTQYMIPCFASLLFACHPVQTEAVTYIVQRFTSLATLFYLLTIITWLKFRISTGPRSDKPKNRINNYIFYLASIVSAVLAMKTKEIAFTLPVVIIVYELIFFNDNKKSRILYLIPHIFTMLIIPLTIIGYGGSFADIKGLDEVAGKMADTLEIQRADYLFTQIRVIVTYIRLLFVPISQNLDYDYPVYHSFFSPAVFLSFLFLTAILILGAYRCLRLARMKSEDGFLFKLCGFGIIWFFVTLSVESSIIPIRDVIFEHRLYLPSIGFFISITSLLEVFAARRGKKINEAIIYCMIIVILVLSFATYKRNSIWTDSENLWQDVVRKSPNKARPHNNLGISYTTQGRFNEAMNEFKIAAKLSPDYANAHYNLGISYATQGRFNEAINEYEIALKNTPDDSDTRDNLGRAYYYQGRNDEAINEYKIGLKLNPDSPELHNNLGLAYHKAEKFDAAIISYKTAIKLNPYLALSYNNLGITYFQQGHNDEAINEYKIALKFNPDFPEAHNNLGLAYSRKGRYDEAESEFKIALILRPDYANAHKNIEHLYETIKKQKSK